MSTIKILFIGAHPDDVELGCGGTIHKLVLSGFDVRVISLAEGTSCRYKKSEINTEKVIEEIKFRTKCSINSLNNLGVSSYKFYDLPCGRLDCEPIIDINKLIENEVNHYKPDSVYTHSYNDVNKDHRIISESTQIVTRPGAKTFVKNIYSYEVLSSSEWNFNKPFNPNRFVSLTKSNLEKKIDSLNMYATEMGEWPYPRSNEGIITLAKYRGMQIGAIYAEAFKVLRSLR